MRRRRDRQIVSQAFGGGVANGNSQYPTISDDGQRIAFASDASNLLAPGADTNGATDFFVFDRGSGTIERVSVRSDGTPVALSLVTTPAPLISGNGRFVLFATSENVDPDDTNGSRDLYMRDLTTDATELVSRNYDGLASGSCSPYSGMSADGRFVAMACTGTDMLAPGKDTLPKLCPRPCEWWPSLNGLRIFRTSSVRSAGRWS